MTSDGWETKLKASKAEQFYSGFLVINRVKNNI